MKFFLIKRSGYNRRSMYILGVKVLSFLKKRNADYTVSMYILGVKVLSYSDSCSHRIKKAGATEAEAEAIIAAAEAAEAAEAEAARIDKVSNFSQDELKEVVSKQFYEYLGYELNLDNPKTFQEKMAWLKLFYQNDILCVCADKYKAPHYVRKKIKCSNALFVHRFGAYDSVEEINFDLLPNSFVLKSNWESGTHIIVADKENTNLNGVKSSMQDWLSPHKNQYYTAYDYSYKHIEPKIICEELLDFEYKLEFHCFNGTPKFIGTVFEDKASDTKADFRDLNWELMPVRHKHPNSGLNIQKPEHFEEMLAIATKLCADFPFVHIGFYITKDGYKFSEITFFPWAGLQSFTPKEYDTIIGDMLPLATEELIRDTTDFHACQFIVDTAKRANLNLDMSSKILDFGCGAGNFMSHLCNCGYDAYGFDMHNYIGEKNNKILNRFQFFKGKVNQRGDHTVDWEDFSLPYPDNSFDFIFTNSVLEHVMNHDKIFAEFARVIKPQGGVYNTFAQKFFLIEQHIKIPFGHLVHNKWYYYFFALLGVKNEFQTGKSPMEIANLNYNYVKTGLNYLSNRELILLAKKYFNNARIDQGAYFDTKNSKKDNKLFKFYYNNFTRNTLLIMSDKEI